MFQNVPIKHNINYHNQNLSLETGLLAQQATATVLATIGQTAVLAAVVVGKPTAFDYFPLQVIYEERMYASGKIKGSRFIKREGRPSDTAVLTGRMIDRSLRSLFDENTRSEIQVVITVLSIDEINQPDTLAVLAASSALSLATKDFLGPVSTIRLGLEKASLGENWLKIVNDKIEQIQDIAELNPLFQEIAQTLELNDSKDKEYLKQIMQVVGRKNPDWAVQMRSVYKETNRLNSQQILEKYGAAPTVLCNPSYAQMENSMLELLVSGNGENITMIESGAKIVDEESMGFCFDKTSEELKLLTDFQLEFINKAKENSLARQVVLDKIQIDEKYLNYWQNYYTDAENALFAAGKKDERAKKLQHFKDIHLQVASLINYLAESSKSLQDLSDKLQDIDSETLKNYKNLVEVEESKLADIIFKQFSLLENLTKAKFAEKELISSFEGLLKRLIKENILNKDRRVDGRALDEIRTITCQVGVLPRTHGSSLFQRGETQVLNIMTLGTLRDAQTLDDMEDFEETTKRYIHHYNFPQYSVGETGRYSGAGRREIGHGALAEKALLPVLPDEEKFPYTMRLVSECLGSNGSTSMASTCGSCLSLMDGGVKIKDMVAGIAMGLMIDQKTGNFKVLTDIQGLEDHDGDMDFKVAGTKDGITALQLDNKVAGLTAEILKIALKQAKVARLKILEIMKTAMDKPRESISEYAPGVASLDIPFDKIGEVIGPSGRVIKAIIQKYQVEVDIDPDTGKTYIYGKDLEKVLQTKAHIQSLVREYAVGDKVRGTIFRIEAYGAFVKFLENEKEGMVHISNLANQRVAKVEDVVKIGDIVEATIISINEKGQISLSLKA